MNRQLILSVILGTFYATFSDGRAGGLQEDIGAFVAYYRTLPEDGQSRHLMPLSPEDKDVILSPLRQKILEMNPQEDSHPELFHLLQEVIKSQENPTTNALDTFKHFLDFSASLGPWTEGDQALSLAFRAVPEMASLSFDSQLSPQVAASNTFKLMLEAIQKREEDPNLRRIIQGTFFHPVVGRELFNPALLTAWFIQNIFPVALSMQGENVIHGLPTSSFGHMLHDMAHGMLVINTKYATFEEDCAKAFHELPFEGMTSEELNVFKDQVSAFLFAKNAAYESALLEAFNHLKDHRNKTSIAGIFFAVHEAGIGAWPHPLPMSHEFAHVTATFLREAGKAFQEYYQDPWETSPKDGAPRDLETIPENVAHLTISEGAETITPEKTIIPHGVVLEVQWTLPSISFQVSDFFRTQKWSLQESIDAQKMFKWAFGTQEHDFYLPVPDDSRPDEDFRAYNKRTLEGIHWLLQEALTNITSFLEAPEGHATQERFSEKIMSLQAEFLDQTREAFDQKPYWYLLNRKVHEMIRPAPTA